MKQFSLWPFRGFAITVTAALLLVAAPLAKAQTSLSPSTLSFPTTAVTNNSASKPLTLSNGGSSALNISGISMIGPDFDQTNNCGKSLAAKKTCTINVVFNPTGTGTRAALITVSYSGGIQLALLSGSAISQTTISPASLAFASQAVNSSSAASAISLKNNQNIALAISKISTTGDFAQTNNCGTSLAAGASCTINSTFKPSALGSRTGSVTIADNATPSTQSISLSGSGSAPVTVSPASLAFSTTQTVGVATAAQVVTVKNLQGIALPISSVALTGDYSQNNTCGTSLAAGASCTVSVTFKPTTAGNRTGTLSITNSAIGSPETVNLVGAGVAATVKSIAVTPATASIAKGKTQQFTAIATYTSGSTADVTATATWTSSSSTAATVSKGLATGVAAGSATMTVSVAGSTITGKAALTVTAPTLASITVTPNPASVPKGKTQQFTAMGSFSDGTAQNLTSSATWSAGTGATINATGMATAAAMGSPVITAKSGTITGTATMTVQAATLVSISVTPATAAIAKGKTQQYAATGTYSDGSTQILTSSATWTSTNGASIAGGLATGTAVGSPTITASSAGISGSAALTVQPAALVSLSVAPATASIAKGLTQQFSATGTYTDGTTQPLTTVTWTAGAGASISGTGLATGTAVGSPAIKATSGAISGTAALTVQPAALTSVTVSPASASIAKGLTQQFSTTGTYTDGTTQTLNATWSATAGANIGSNGLATGTGIGIQTVTATSGSFSGTAALTVQPAALVSIAVSPASATVVRGSSQQFTAQGTYTDGTFQDVSNTVSWSASSGATLVGGLATGTVVGTPTITATSGSITGVASLTVQLPNLVSIMVAPDSVSLGLHAVQQFTATGLYADNTSQDVTSSVLWNSGNSSVVTIGANGVANVLATSTSAIPVSASFGGLVSNTVWLSALAELQPVCASPTIDMKLLVVTNGKTEADFPAIKQVLDYLGTPYTVLDMKAGGVTADMLSDGNCHGYYQGVIFALGNYIYTLPGMANLNSYEQMYHVRQVNWFLFPDTNFGVNPYNNSVDASSTYSANFAPAAESIFSYANTTAPLSFSHAFIYLATPVDGSVTPLPAGASVTPLLTDASGNALSVIYNLGDGREYLSQTFDSNANLTHNLILSYGLINWVTRGVFLGEYHIYAAGQVDDFFINDAEWVPKTPCSNPTTHDRTVSDDPSLPTFRLKAGDMTALAAWQNGLQNDPLLKGFKLTLAFNGVGTTGNKDWTGLPVAGVANDDLTMSLPSYERFFHWITHTFDHPETLNGLHQSDTGGDPEGVDSIDLEILTNLFVASGTTQGGANLDVDPADSGLKTLHFTDFNPSSMVSPGVTGLNDQEVPTYLYNDGIRYVVSDTSVIGQPNNGPNPSPNVGIVNSYEPGIYEVPRYPNSIYYNAANWDDDEAEFHCIYGPDPGPATQPYDAYVAADILNYTSDTFVTNMLKGDIDPQMFHQPNLHAYDGTNSLISDVYNQTFAKYEALFKLPVLSLTLDQLGESMKARNNYNLSGATASLVNAGSVDASISITVPSGTTVPSAVIPVTGLSSNGSEVYGGQNISHVNVSAGETITLPLE